MQKTANKTSILITRLIACVWLINGLFCKVLNLVPRHKMIVARILGDSHAGEITVTIGILEVLMAAWVVSRIKPGLCAVTQVVLIAAMNVLEFALAPDLLLFGKANSLFAAVFILFILFSEFGLAKNPRLGAHPPA